jgi:hypothetical protein
MPIQRNANFEQHMISEDLILRDALQVVHDNTDNLQNQIDIILEVLTNETTYADFRTELLNRFA